MEIPLLDLKAQYRAIKDEIDQAVNSVIESQSFILSEEVSSLEEEVASYCGVKFGCGVASGTDALVLSLRAMGVGPGDLVVTTPFTFFATSEAVSVLGAEPVFVDINAESYNMDPVKLEEFLNSCDTRTLERIKAVIPVHMYGQCADMENIGRIAGEHSFAVIEDSAQAIGALRHGRRAGAFSNAGCLSFFPSKNLGGFGDAGMVVTSDAATDEKVRRLRVHGSAEQYIHEEIGYNSRLDSLQAAVLRVKLRHLDKWLEKRRQIARRYDSYFADLPVSTPKVSEGNEHTYHQYTIACDRRNELLEHLHAKGIAARVYYPVPMHLQPCYKVLDLSIGSLPVSERLSEQVLSLPVYPELSDDQIEYIAQAVVNFVKSH